MCLFLPHEKVLKTQSLFQHIHAKSQVTVHELTKRSSCLLKSVSFVSFDEFLVSSVTGNKSIESNSVLSSNCIPRQQFKGGTSMIDPKSPDFQWTLPNSACQGFLKIRTDASKNGRGPVCQGISTEEEWNLQEY